MELLLVVLLVFTVFFVAVAGHFAHKAEVLQRDREKIREPWYSPKPSRNELLYKKVNRLFITASLGSFLLLILFAVGGTALVSVACILLALTRYTLAIA